MAGRSGVYTQEHEDFRAAVRSFIDRTVVPQYDKWIEDKLAPRSFFTGIAELGVQGMAVPEQFGGAGIRDYRYNAILQEEAASALVTLGTLRTQLDVILPYFLDYTNEEQQRRWLPGIATGELLTAIAMTEPDTGSDLAGVQTTARRDGDHYVLDGAKTFITGGGLADLVIVLARTGTDADDRRRGLSLLVVEEGMAGFTRGRRLDKIGLAVQDTVELHFDGVRVPAANLMGEEGEAFGYLGRNLAQERLAIAVGAVAQAQAAVDITVEHAKSRSMFGTTLSTFQNTKFELAAVTAEVYAAQKVIDAGVIALSEGTLGPVEAATTKLFCTEVQGRVIDRCLQLFGGYGYITEMPIARLYADARVTRIYGGTSEVMKTIIARSLGL